MERSSRKDSEAMKIVAFSTTIFLLSVGALQATERPMRRDCILLVDLRWGTETASERDAVINRMPDALWSFRLQGNAPVATQISSQGDIYLQFSSGCDSKRQLARKLMLHMKNKISSFPAFTITSDIVEPGLLTIDVCGKVWRDCQSEN